jgi:hypothetical protein
MATFCSLIIGKDFWNIPVHFFRRVIRHSSVMQMNKNYLEELEVFEVLMCCHFHIYCPPASDVFISHMFIRKCADCISFCNLSLCNVH